MNDRDRVRFREALTQKRQDTLDAGPAKIEPNRKDTAAVGVADEDEQALSEMMQTLASERNRQQTKLVSEIDRALRKLRETPDDFGMCEECEEDIAQKRLQLMPYARLCAECQTKLDPKRKVSRKSLTDYK